MKKAIFFTSFLLMLGFNVCAQHQTVSVIWKIFCSGSLDWEKFETGYPKQDFIDVKQEDNKFYWGQDNVYHVYNKQEKHEGFTTTITYDFIDKYKQRGSIIYTHNRAADWATKYMFFIKYEGMKEGKYYCSNEPNKK